MVGNGLSRQKLFQEENGIIFPNTSTYKIVSIGDIDGFLIKYNDTDTITITSGFCEANGKAYKLTADTTYDLSGLDTSYDVHYIYIDDSASSNQTPTFIDSTTEPSYSITKQGLYNGNDRCIGCVHNHPSLAQIIWFSSSLVGKNISFSFGMKDDVASALPPLGTNMAPDDNFNAPNVNELSSIVPVNTKSATIYVYNTETSATVVSIGVKTDEHPATSLFRGNILLLESDGTASGKQSGNLDASRDIEIAGRNLNDDALDVHCQEYTFAR